MNQSFFQEAARLNNDGVTALIEGDEATSIDVLMSTVKMMKQYIASSDQTFSLASGSGNSPDCFESFSFVEIPSKMNDGHFFFHQAIKMPCDEEIFSPLDVYVFSAAVIFNLALSHHIQGAENIKARKKAEKLYATIMNVLDDRVVHMQSALLLKLSCINNMAHIRLENGEFDQIQDALVGELEALVKSTDKHLLEGPEVQELLMSVLLLEKPKFAAAA